MNEYRTGSEELRIESNLALVTLATSVNVVLH